MKSPLFYKRLRGAILFVALLIGMLNLSGGWILLPVVAMLWSFWDEDETRHRKP